MKRQRPSVLTVTNQKGGVAKTTTVVQVLAALASMNKRVCGIDLDYQANLTRAFKLKEKAKGEEKTMSRAIEERLTLADIRMKTDYPNVDLVCSDLNLVYQIQRLTGTPRQASVVKHLLDCKETDDYDVIIIDTHPSPDCLFQSAIAASDYYCIPVFAEPDPLEGMQYMIRLIDEVRSEHNRNLSFLGILVTRFQKNNTTHKRFEPLLRKLGRDRNFNVFGSVIPTSNAIQGAAAAQIPLIFDPSKKSLPVSKAYMDFTRELLPKLKGRSRGRKPSSPDFSNVEFLEQAFETELDFSDKTEQLNLQ